MAQQKQSPLQVIQFLRLTYLLEPPLLWTALPSQCAVLCFPEHATTGTAGSEENCSCETAVTFTTAMCYNEMTNFEAILSKSQTGCDSTYQICSSLLSLQGFETGGSQAQLPPGAQRDAILLPWSLRIPCRSLTCHTARSKQYGHGAAKQSTGRKCQPAAI